MSAWFGIILILSSAEWGFFGHRLINRTAVYTLPTEMIGWYKPHIDYISEHAVDPDKRRYATRHEAVRHYIDLDQWGQMPFEHLPKYWDHVLALNLKIYEVHETDTILVIQPVLPGKWLDTIHDLSQRLHFVRHYYLPKYYEDEKQISCDSLHQFFSEVSCEGVVYVEDVFSGHGIIPYHLQAMQARLTNAFRERNLEAILRISAEIGHYIGDACVPLHTTSNYNGQKTGQQGIHAFWESRIPELFAIEEFDMVVGTATYIEDPAAYYWDLVLDSHKEVEEVLNLERELSKNYPVDKQYCFEDRLNQLVKTQCTDYARAYHLAMNKMVEDRFRVAVKALGNAWYTAWIDSGQPPAEVTGAIEKQSKEDADLDQAFRSGKVKGREHSN